MSTTQFQWVFGNTVATLKRCSASNRVRTRNGQYPVNGILSGGLPEVLGPEEIRSYQVYLTNERKLVRRAFSGKVGEQKQAIAPSGDGRRSSPHIRVSTRRDSSLPPASQKFYEQIGTAPRRIVQKGDS